MLDPAGSYAEPVATLTWGLLAMCAVVCLVVGVALWIAIWGRGRWRSALRGERLVIAGGLLFPAVVLTVLLVWGLTLTAGLTRPGRDEVRIQVTGNQWWWRVSYLGGPAAGLSDANEVHIPVGQTVTLELASQDVIHSFWVPRLSGKLDMIPGRTNRLRIHADKPGVYRGQCAEYCGGAHALMALVVVARPQAEHRAWARARLASARAPTTPEAIRGRDLFFAEGCDMCHTVRGEGAGGRAGPDLTHVGSRLSLAAGVLPNERGAYGAWISGNQSLKPGARMPEYRLTGPDLVALSTYLEGLT